MTPGTKRPRLSTTALAALALPPDQIPQMGRPGPQAPGDAAGGRTRWESVRDRAATGRDGRVSDSRSRSKPSGRIDGPYLKGPIAMTWLRRTYGLCPGALILATELWWLRGMAKSDRVEGGDPVPASQVEVSLARVSRETNTTEKVLRPGLKALEAASLITVLHRPGRKLQVTFCDVVAVPCSTVPADDAVTSDTLTDAGDPATEEPG